MTEYASSRLATIESIVKALFNDDSGRFFTQAQFIALANEALVQIAQKKLFRQEGTIDAVVDVWEYDIPTALDDFVDVHSCRWTTAEMPMEHLRSMTEFDEIRVGDVWYEYTRDAEGPAFWYQQGPTLSVWPPPEETTAAGIVLRYSYIPTAFDLELWHTTTLIPVWTANTIMEMGAIRQATVWDGFVYEVTGLSGDMKTHASTQPTWSGVTVDHTVVDDMVTWTKRLYVPNYTPASLPANDGMYVEWILFRLFQRKGGAPGAAQAAADHRTLFDIECRSAMAAFRGPRRAIVPGR